MKRTPYVSRRKDSRKLQITLRVPKHALHLKGQRRLLHLSSTSHPLTVTVKIGAVVSFSGHTLDPVLYEVRRRDAEDQLVRIFNAAGRPPAKLNHMQLTALSGLIHQLHIDMHEKEPGTTFQWTAAKAFHRAVIEGRIINPPTFSVAQLPDEIDSAVERFGEDLTAGINALPTSEGDDAALEERFGLLADWALGQREITLAPGDRRRLLLAAGAGALRAGMELKRLADGDYSPDKYRPHYPKFEDGATVSLDDLLAGWWSEAKSLGKKTSTHRVYAGVIERFKEFTKNKNAAKITKQDVLDYKTFRLKSASPKTVLDHDLAALNSIFRWSFEHLKISSNPALDVRFRPAKKAKLRGNGYTDSEAVAILTLASSYVQTAKELPQTAAGRRWLPWLLAYTGARITELAQARKGDFWQDAGRWVIRITPEAGATKNNEARIVPLHLHLIDLGFIQYVESCNGPLFVRSEEDGKSVGVVGVVNRLREFLAPAVPVGISPNHAWRHRVKTQFRRLGVDKEVRDAIQGHAVPDEAGKYGEIPLDTMCSAIDRLPRYKVDGPIATRTAADSLTNQSASA